MNKNSNQPRKKNATIAYFIIFFLLTGLGVFLALLATGVVPGKKADNVTMWLAASFCFIVGGLGSIFSLKSLILEKIAKKKFKENGVPGEEHISEEITVFKNAIPALKNRNNLDVKDKTFKKYCFKQVGRSIVKYKLLNESNNVIYDSHRLNKTLFVPLKVAFNNHVTNKTFYHIIGRTLVGDGYRHNHFMQTPFSFRVDGLKIDDYCEMLNIQMTIIDTNRYEIRYKNAVIGNITRLVTKKLVKPSMKVDPIIVECIEDYLDIVYFLCFAVGFCGRDYNN